MKEEKERLIKELEKLKAESVNYSKNVSMNEGYRVAVMDAIDLVKKLITSVCPYCGSIEIYAWGEKDNKCKSCELTWDV
ncbi:MAG: hypothetical protein GY756_27045 [bacterium]|nr:hypothetical protein [bacterium]